MTGSSLLTVAEVAAALRLSHQRVYQLIESGELVALRVTSGPKGALRISPDDLAAYLADANDPRRSVVRQVAVRDEIELRA